MDNSGPVLTISAPSKTVASSNVSFTVTSNESTTFNFSAEDVVLNGTGTADGTVSVTGSGTSTRTITISNLIGDGTLAISLPADIAQDSIGNRNIATNVSQSFKLGCETGSQTFNFTGSSEQFIVPDRCSSIVVTIQGGAGGSGTKTTGQTPTPGVGGVGGKIKGTITTSPGIIFNIFVAKQGGTCGNINSYYHCGGGGGGASAIVRASNNTPMLIAGGGSGGTSIKPT